ncbi:hypothetical protein HOT82_gp076 [Gordonia phage Ronaldo]|uniref:Uncharacterized protein n=4 Tax=Ronaldovirus TaxID=2733205 RepID=A0A6B9L8C2_9CAUD|nr:hypothetical protein HOT81_gp072 [Gordonia phage Fryberger]YP_009807772.1 hypothetical protein HOT82_gp076 [Gordonia phage Ronaldo]QDH48415.1 hypothetical protein SEA_ZIKO_76 [Gordonia phage Ziko]QHB38192.1 hypothetical protein SEA_VOLT_76 [Gordonia phage Volt]AXN53490.1 hypothetical protein SEA_FRYBERGER_72 [Gordonia phage Fryberger]AXN53638.1 hypothetical protein SEA_RONALDO_76 [Gordonia phage Ronaldo]
MNIYELENNASAAIGNMDQDSLECVVVSRIWNNAMNVRWLVSKRNNRGGNKPSKYMIREAISVVQEGIRIFKASGEPWNSMLPKEVQDYARACIAEGREELAR